MALQRLELFELPAEMKETKLLLRAIKFAPNIRELSIGYRPARGTRGRIAMAFCLFLVLARPSLYNVLTLRCSELSSLIALLFHRKQVERVRDELRTLNLLGIWPGSSLLFLFAEAIRGNQIVKVTARNSYYTPLLCEYEFDQENQPIVRFTRNYNRQSGVSEVLPKETVDWFTSLAVGCSFILTVSQV